LGKVNPIEKNLRMRISNIPNRLGRRCTMSLKTLQKSIEDVKPSVMMLHQDIYVKIMSPEIDIIYPYRMVSPTRSQLQSP
jgi:hypothetical protein